MFICSILYLISVPLKERNKIKILLRSKHFCAIIRLQRCLDLSPTRYYQNRNEEITYEQVLRLSSNIKRFSNVS